MEQDWSGLDQHSSCLLWRSERHEARGDTLDDNAWEELRGRGGQTVLLIPPSMIQQPTLCR